MKDLLNALHPKTVFGEYGLFLGLLKYLVFLFIILICFIPFLFWLCNEWSKSWFGGDSFED